MFATPYCCLDDFFHGNDAFGGDHRVWQRVHLPRDVPLILVGLKFVSLSNTSPASTSQLQLFLHSAILINIPELSNIKSFSSEPCVLLLTSSPTTSTSTLVSVTPISSSSRSPAIASIASSLCASSSSRRCLTGYQRPLPRWQRGSQPAHWQTFSLAFSLTVNN